MKSQSQKIVDRVSVEKQNIQQLIDVLLEEGYLVIGPSVQDHAIMLDEITSISELPVGWKDSQDAATYRLENQHNEALFDYVVGPQSWKKYLFPKFLI